MTVPKASLRAPPPLPWLPPVWGMDCWPRDRENREAIGHGGGSSTCPGREGDRHLVSEDSWLCPSALGQDTDSDPAGSTRSRAASGGAIPGV